MSERLIDIQAVVPDAVRLSVTAPHGSSVSLAECSSMSVESKGEVTVALPAGFTGKVDVEAKQVVGAPEVVGEGGDKRVLGALGVDGTGFIYIRAAGVVTFAAPDATDPIPEPAEMADPAPKP